MTIQLRAKLIMMIVRFVMGAIALGAGIWYISASVGGSSLTYTSMDNFMTAIGATDGNVANVNGCFLCGYLTELFTVIGNATEMFWNSILKTLWILMAVGLGIYLFVETIRHIWAATKQTAKLDTSEKKLDFMSWAEKIGRQAIRVTIVGVLIGALGMGGTGALKTITNITIMPVMTIGAELSMAATGVGDAAQCRALEQSARDADDILSPVMSPFMCVVGNLNSVMLAGAVGGFSLMNYSWMGLGGGLFTWIAGLGMVILFLVIGFNLFFRILSVVFKLVFIIIFMPLLLAAVAFEKVWPMAAKVSGNAIDMLVKSVVSIVAITLEIIILYATISYAADAYFPGPVDGYSAVMPPLLGAAGPENPDAKTMAIVNVFSECERVALVDGEMDGDKFSECFDAKRVIVEQKYPGAFDFMANGWDFMMLMFGLFFLYYYAVAPGVKKILAAPGNEEFDFGAWTKQLGQQIWSVPRQLAARFTKRMGT